MNNSRLKISRKASIIMDNSILVDLRRSVDETQQELIKQMKLDFVWLGVMSRLGSDVNEFQEVIIDE